MNAHDAFAHWCSEWVSFRSDELRVLRLHCKWPLAKNADLRRIMEIQTSIRLQGAVISHLEGYVESSRLAKIKAEYTQLASVPTEQFPFSLNSGTRGSDQPLNTLIPGFRIRRFLYPGVGSILQYLGSTAPCPGKALKAIIPPLFVRPYLCSF